MGLSRASGSGSTLWSCILHCARIDMDIRKGRGFACFTSCMGDCGLRLQQEGRNSEGELGNTWLWAFRLYYLLHVPPFQNLVFRTQWICLLLFRAEDQVCAAALARIDLVIQSESFTSPLRNKFHASCCPFAIVRFTQLFPRLFGKSFMLGQGLATAPVKANPKFYVVGHYASYHQNQDEQQLFLR